ncbi:MAG: hypothetical protein D8M59_04775 [Planctomycetes bacterium]|nr:hypothetical protein [Planctomycetota bacterium]NOG55822.1 hypothetical protein [Planctomycetota bacterium]
MLLTLTARSLEPLLARTASDRRRIESGYDQDGNVEGGARSPIAIEDIPRFAMERIGLRGLVVDTSLLRGWPLDRLDRLRMQADQSGCPCLILRESAPVVISAGPGVAADESDKTFARIETVAKAAHRLGCNAFSLRPYEITSDIQFDAAADLLRKVMDRIDRMELNLLIEPGGGTLANPQVLIELVKKVGGFRIGTMPSFAYAARTEDSETTLRQTAPFSSAIVASCSGLEASGDGHAAETATRVDLAGSVQAIKSVGYEQILALDYYPILQSKATGKKKAASPPPDPIPILDAARQTIEQALEKD